MKNLYCFFLLFLVVTLSSCVSHPSASVRPSTTPSATHSSGDEMLSDGDDMNMADHDSFEAAGMTHVLSYTSKKFQYIVTLPQRWKFDDHPGAYLGAEGDVVFYPPSISSKDPHAPKIIITSPDTSPNMSSQAELTAWIAKPISSTKSNEPYKIGNATVAGMPAVQYITQGQVYHLVTWFRKNDRNFYIEIGDTEADATNYRKDYDLMINNVSFIE